MKIKTWVVVLLLVFLTTSLFAATSIPSNFDALTVFQKFLVLSASLICAVILSIISWVIFPYTLAPLTILLRSPFSLLGNRIALAFAAAFLGFVITFGILSKKMVDPIKKMQMYEQQYK